MSRSAIHLVMHVFHDGKLVMRETLMHSKALQRWHGASYMGVSLRGVDGRSPLPPPDRASLGLTIFNAGQLTTTLVGFSASHVHPTHAAHGEKLTNTLRFERSAKRFKRAACVDIFCDHAGGREWRAHAFATMNDEFLNEILFD